MTVPATRLPPFASATISGAELDHAARDVHAQDDPAQLAAHTLRHDPGPEQIRAFAEHGEQWREQVETQSAALAQAKEKRGRIPRKVQLKELPEAERYRQLCPESKHFIDTIKIIAYRAKSALAGELGEHLQRGDDKRALLRRLFVTPANLRLVYRQVGSG